MSFRIEHESGLVLELNKQNYTSSVVKSPKAIGNVFIPKNINYEGENYSITAINEGAFQFNKIESLTFPEDSEVLSFETGSFSYADIKKLQIPSNLKNIKDCWCFYIINLTEIEVSPNNKFFSFIDNQFLVGKSQESIKYDILHYARYDIVEAIIPPQIKVIKPYAFGHHSILRSVIFPENSEVTFLDNRIFTKTDIHKLVLPANLENVESDFFKDFPNLTDLQISQKNQIFSYTNNQYLIRKYHQNEEILCSIVFCRRDADEIEIPFYIKKIDSFAFSNCTKLSSVTFDPHSTIQIIDNHAFSGAINIIDLIIPASVYFIGDSAFSELINLNTITFLGKKIKIGFECFNECLIVNKISFPKATDLYIDSSAISNISESAVIYIRDDAELNEDFEEEFDNQIEFIETEEEEGHLNEEENNNYNNKENDKCDYKNNNYKKC